ncbi:uncharacterized protein JCM6883_006694 [Sporobolomyces salmoneus]|uniref:uncharacterized protein n=1 Tax=Sporobolomyces salmoneus TaxID=183962 RepID=UPI003179CAF6
MTQFEDHNDLHAYSFGLDTPSKYLTESFGTGLTPSLFGSLGGPRGFTPSMGTDTVSTGEYNPFELSLGPNVGDKTRRSSFSALLEAPLDAQTNSIPSDFDLLSTSTLSNGRKRALSSPAVTTPGGSSFPFLLSNASSTTRIPTGAMPNLAIKPSKRPRISAISSGSGLSDFRIPSAGHSDTSPESSEVPTPPDSYLVQDRTAQAPTTNDIDVNGGSNASIFSKLQQQQQFLLAGNAQTSFSQPLPLPLGPLPLDNQTQSESPSAPVPIPVLTRSASKKGKTQARASPAPSSAGGSPAAPQPKPKRGGGRKKAATQTKKQAAEQEKQEKQDEDGDLSEDSLKRKQFLERNRVAACKSRQKKKEKVGKLEQDATDLCQKNQLLQAAALALRQEILTLRQIIQTHDGCSCEHAQGYLQRDKEGRGIALLDNLAGRTMHLDYSVAPEMGSTDDVYSYLEDYARNGTVQEAFSHGIAPPQSQAMLPITDAPMPNLASAPSFAPSTNTVPSSSTSSKNHSRRQSDTSLFQNSSSSTNGIFTRSAAAQPALFQPPSFSYDSVPSIQPQSHFGLTYDSNTSNQLSMAPVATVDPSTQALLGAVPPPSHPILARRQSSAPPTTPGWQPKSSTTSGGDYFSYSSTNNS